MEDIKLDSDEDVNKIKLLYVYERNINNHVHDFTGYSDVMSDFERGFHECIDFFQFVYSHFNIIIDDKLWPPKSDYDKEQRLDQNGYLTYNYFWKKYKDGGNPFYFYNSLDYSNKRVLYNWYKTEMKNRLIN